MEKAKKKKQDHELKKEHKKKLRPDLFELTRCLNSNDAVFLIGLMEIKDRYVDTPTAEREFTHFELPWFPCSLTEVQELLMFDTQKQKRMFNLYRSLGILSFKMGGFPGRRYIKINFNRLREVLESIKKGKSVQKEDNDEEVNEEKSKR